MSKKNRQLSVARESLLAIEAKLCVLLGMLKTDKNIVSDDSKCAIAATLARESYLLLKKELEENDKEMLPLR